jgi:hypothetical protein
MNGGASWPHWMRQSARPGERPLPAVPLPWYSRLLQVGGLLLVALLAVAAERLPNAPALLPPVWLATGAATVLAMRWPSWRMGLGIGLALLVAAPASGLLQPPGVPGLPGWSGLAEAAVATLQACITARAMHRLWATLRADHHRLHQVRLTHLFRMVFLVVLPRALLAGLLMTALHAWDPLAVQDDGAVPWRLGLLFATASSLSILVLVPLLWLGRAGVGPRGTAWALAIASAAAILASLETGIGLYAMPLLALAAGYLGGIGLASLCCTVMVVSMMIGINFYEMPPFEGPDGFVVLLLFVYRLTATAYLASVWSDRRARRGAGRSAGRAATVHLDLAGLAAASTAAAARQADTPAVLLWVRWPLADQAPGSDARIAARNSQASSANALTLAGMLRQGDAMAHAGIEGLLVMLDDLRPEDGPGVVARVTAKVLVMSPLATVSAFAMNRRALALCLVSAAAFEAEVPEHGIPPTAPSAPSAPPAPPSKSAQREQGRAVEAAHPGA